MTQADTSDIDMAKMINDAKCVTRNQANTSFLFMFTLQRQKVQEGIVFLYGALSSEEDDPPSILEHSTTILPDSFTKSLNHPQLLAQIREIVQKKASRIYALEMDKYLLKAAEDASKT